MSKQRLGTDRNQGVLTLSVLGIKHKETYLVIKYGDGFS